jgi:hypothetical protein
VAEIHADAGQHAGRPARAQAEQAQQQVLRADVGMVELTGLVARPG